jgi:hypothetical protein
VFHGHAHGGQLEGQTRTGVPVYNVARPLLERRFPDRPPFRVLEIHRGGDNGGPTGSASPLETVNRG